MDFDISYIWDSSGVFFNHKLNDIVLPYAYNYFIQ